jgi:hypothetical protein
MALKLRSKINADEKTFQLGNRWRFNYPQSARLGSTFDFPSGIAL